MLTAPATFRAVRWDPAVELKFGESISLLDTEVWLALEPGVSVQVGQHLPGGVRAPFRLSTSLERSLLSGPRRGPVPLSIPGPGDANPTARELPLAGPGMSLTLWRRPGGDADSAAPSAADSRAFAWAYLRVLEVSGAGVWLEVAEAAASVQTLERDPVGLEMGSDGALTWTSFRANDEASSSTTYRVERRELGATAWSPLAEGIGRDDDGLHRWVDASASASPPRVFEYRVLASPEADLEAGRESEVGAYVRAHAFPEGDAAVGPGVRVNLVSGKSVGPDETAHVEVGRSSAGVLVLTPLDDVRFSRDLAGKGSKSVKPKSHVSAGTRTWRLPDETDPSWLPSKSVALRDGDEVDFLIGERLRGRLGVTEVDASTWLARRRLAIDGAGLLARSPGPPLGAEVLEPGHPGVSGVRLKLPMPGEWADVRASDVVFAVEREIPLGSQRWTTVARSSPGASSLVVQGAFAAADPGVEARPIARLRLRVGAAFGQLSGPGASMDVLAAGSDDAALGVALDQALSHIADVDFLVRMEARAVLRVLGDRGRPALESLAQTSSGEPSGLAAAEILRELEQAGGGERFRRALRSNALDAMRRSGSQISSELDAWLGLMPQGLDAATVNERAHALLLAVDRAERGVASAEARGDVAEDLMRMRAWLEAASFAETDEGRRWLSRFLMEVGLAPSLASFEAEAPAWLLPAPMRLADEPLDFPWGGQPATAEELRWFLESRPEISHRDLGPVLARLHAALEPPGDAAPWGGTGRVAPRGAASGGGESGDAPADGPSAGLFDYDARTAELVLRLVERVRRGLGSAPDTSRPLAPGEAAILAAAKALLPGERLPLLAGRAVSDRRLASPSPEAPPGRTVIRLEGGDLATLQAALLELPLTKGASQREAGVDIVLAGG
ncbi:MAG: hypothetical protein AAGG01_15080, partial [Planctomycetota bacterium]